MTRFLRTYGMGFYPQCASIHFYQLKEINSFLLYNKEIKKFREQRKDLDLGNKGTFVALFVVLRNRRAVLL